MLEAVVVVGVLLALAVGGFFAYGPITKNAKMAKVKSAVSEVYTAVTVAQIDGDPTTSVVSVIDSYNASQNTIKFEIRRGETQPTIAAMSTAGYVPQSDNDFCLKATSLGDVSIFAEMGDCKVPTPAPVPTQPPAPTPTPTLTATPTPTVVPTPTPTPTVVTTPTLTPGPIGYVDPTPTKTIMTYKCDSNVSGAFPFGNMSQGTLTLTGDDGSKVEKVYTNKTNTDAYSLKAGITYQAVFDGKYSSFAQGGSLLASCIRSFDHWGEQSGVIKAASGMAGASKLISVPEHIPSTVTDLSYFFQNNTIFNDPNISKWDVSNVTTFAQAFNSAKAFNQPLNDWKMSHVTNISGMFLFTDSFNQPLDKWDTSSIIKMDMAFTYAKTFNQNINNWNVSKVTTMNDMFKTASRFNQPLDKWDVSNVTTMDSMFRDATLFNQNIGTWRPVKVTDMDYMFAYNTVFKQDLSSWTFNVRPANSSWAPTGLPTTSYPKF
jgi:surface protein